MSRRRTRQQYKSRRRSTSRLFLTGISRCLELQVEEGSFTFNFHMTLLVINALGEEGLRGLRETLRGPVIGANDGVVELWSCGPVDLYTKKYSSVIDCRWTLVDLGESKSEVP